jgi:hypothetical protein
MTVELQDLRRFVKQCDPLRPLEAGDPLYVPLDDVRGTVSCIDALYRTVALADGESCQLFTGFPGTGKTTELKRLAKRLEDAKDLPTHTIYVDFEEFVDRYSPISITDVMRVIAYAMDREATIAEGKDPDKTPGYLERFFEYVSKTDVEVKNLGFAAYGASLMLEMKNNPSFRQKAESALQGRFQQFVSDAQAVMAESVKRLRGARGAFAQRVVVIADGLEKFAPLREDDRATMEASIETLFLTHRDLLRIPCHAIYTFPLWLRFRTAQLGTSYGREPLILPMVKVHTQDGAAHDAGIAKMTEMVRRRVEVLPPIFGADLAATLRPIIEASGGYPRDLLRMVRSLLMEIMTFPVLPVDSARVVGELARSYADTIVGTYVDVLARVATTHELPKENAEELALFGYLFERWLILAYRNGEEWYDLHPLVRLAPAVKKKLAALAVQKLAGG